jgi:hypothetical protein
VIVRAGDVLLVSVGMHVTIEQASMIRSELMDQLPDLADVIVLPALDVAAYRPDDAGGPL